MSDLDLLVRWFESSEEASQQARSESEQCRDYFDANQLTAKQKEELKRRRQPIVIENLIRPKVESLCGLESQSRTDPKALPRTAAHDDDAFAVTDGLRYVADDQKLDLKRSAVFKNMLIEGFGGVEVGAHRARGGVDPTVVGIAWHRLFYDQHSEQLDFSDSAYLGFITWMDLDDARFECGEGRKWAGKLDTIEATLSKPHSSHFATYDDKPTWASWSDSTRKRIRVNTCYYRKGGVWYRAVYTLAGLLEHGESPWLDENGKPECGLILQSAYVDRDNDRYGIVRDFISLQDEVNKRRSKALHMFSGRPVRVSPTADQDAETVRREIARPDGVIVGEQGDVEILPLGDIAAGHFSLLSEAKSAIRTVGPNAYMQGKAGEGQSGRAILAMQSGGMTEMTPIMDSLRDFNARVYRAIWNRIRQFWTEERWVRVTDDDRNVRFVGFNVSKGAVALRRVKEALVKGEIDQQRAAEFERQIQLDPSMLQPANVIADMDVDITIEEVPDSPSVQIEEFEQLVKLAASQPGLVPLEMIVEASSLRSKAKLLQIMKEKMEGQGQPNPAQELAMKEALARIGKLEAEANHTNARAQTEAIKPALEGFRTGMAA